MSFQTDLETDLSNVFIDTSGAGFADSGGTFQPAGAAAESSIDYVVEELFFSPETSREESRFRIQASDLTAVPAPGDLFTDAGGTVWSVAQVRNVEGEYQLTCFSLNVRQ